MKGLIERLRRLPLRFRPPASPASLKALADDLKRPLPLSLHALYLDHDGVEREGPLAMRLLSLKEVRELLPHFAEFEACPFWENGSDCAAVLLSGPQKGQVCFIDHEEPDPTPKFRSPESFMSTLLDHAGKDLDWRELPVEDLSDPGILDALRKALADARTETAHRWTSFRVIDLLGREDFEELTTFARNTDPYVRERACERIGKLKIEVAVELLYDIARNGTHNDPISAIVALGRLGSSDAGRRLADLAPHMPGYDVYIASALEKCGATVDRGPRPWRFRLPGDTDGRPIA